MQGIELRIKGKVQGVGFRYSTQREALQLGVTGYARNLDDGGVEVLVCGEAEQVEKLKALKEELAKVPEPCGELDAVIQVAVGCESKKYWNPIGTYRVVIDGTEYMVELEEETERFR